MAAMRFAFRQSREIRRSGLATALAVAFVAAGATCSDAATIFQRLFGGGQKAESPPAGALQVDPNDFAAPAYCPELHLQVGGEAYATFQPDHDGEAKYVRYLGSISQTARECLSVSDTALSLKVGVSGRVVAGPKGGIGKVTMPIRVTVVKQHGNKVLFDKTYPTAMSVSGSDLKGTFSQVFEPISFKRTANDEDLIIYVGFVQDKPAAGPTG
jgi:hypothetical protein